MIKNIAKKADVWHLIERGELVEHHFDFEAFSLETNFAQIASYGDAIGDIAGNFIDSTEYHVKRPDRYIPTIESLAVTKTGPYELEEEGRLDHHEAMGKIAGRFESASMMVQHLDLESEDISFETVRVFGNEEYGKEHQETVLKYPLLDDEGNVVYDVRIHPDRNMIAFRLDDDVESDYYHNEDVTFYRDENGDRWKMIKPRTLESGYRIKWYDMAVLRANLIRAGYHPKNTFFAHSKATITDKEMAKNHAVDGYSVVMNTHLFGKHGEEGLQIDRRIDQNTGEDVSSAKLELVMQKNSRFENATLGISEGVRMPDGSVYDQRKAHKSPAYDSMASYQIYNFCRKLEPEILKEIEVQADKSALQAMLPGNNLVDPQFPIFGMLRNDWRTQPHADPLAFVGFDDRQGKPPRRAILARLDIDLRNYKYNGQTLLDMLKAHEETDDAHLYQSPIYRLLKDKLFQHDCPFRIEGLKRWGGAIPFDKCFNSKSSATWDIEELDSNFAFLRSHPALKEAIMDCVEIINYERQQEFETPANPVMEEQWLYSGFGELDYYEREAEYERYKRRKDGMKSYVGKGRIHSFAEMLFERASREYIFFNDMDNFLHHGFIQPHPIDWSDDEDVVKNYGEQLRKIYRKLKKKDSPHVALFKRFVVDEKFKPSKSPDVLRRFRTETLKRLLRNDEKERNDKNSDFADGFIDSKNFNKRRQIFANASRDFRVIDEGGREVSLNVLRDLYRTWPNEVIQRFDSKKWRIQFYRLSSEPSVSAILMQFADKGRLKELPEIWQDRYDTLKRLYLNGPPNQNDLSDSDIRWLGIPQLDRQLKALEVNAKGGSFKEGLRRVFRDATAAGAAEIYLQSDEGQRFLSDYREFLDTIRKGNALSEDFVEALHYDPETGAPYDYIEFEIPQSRNRHVIIDVPDPHLRAPLHDIRVGVMSLVVPEISKSKRDKIEKGYPVILRGQQTGRLYAAGKTDIAKALPENGSTEDYYDLARRAYEGEAGMDFPPASKRDVIVIQDVMPLAATRKIDPSVPTFRVPLVYLDGLVAPELAFREKREPIQGLLMPSDVIHQRVEEGQSIRFRGMIAEMNAKIEGTEGEETGDIYESNVVSVNRITVGELCSQIQDGSFTDADARRYGYAGAYPLRDSLLQSYNQVLSPDPYAEELTLIEFEKVDKKSWAYFNPPEAPRAAMVAKGQRVSPSAYRDLLGVKPVNGPQPG